MFDQWRNQNYKNRIKSYEIEKVFIKIELLK